MKALGWWSERDWPGALIPSADRVAGLEVFHQKLDVHSLCSTRQLLRIGQHSHAKKLSRARVDDDTDGRKCADVYVRNYTQHREIVGYPLLVCIFCHVVSIIFAPRVGLEESGRRGRVLKCSPRQRIWATAGAS